MFANLILGLLQGSTGPVPFRQEKVSFGVTALLNLGLWDVSLSRGAAVIVLLGSKL